ncbi:hypothetical protein EVAR_3117_1 [Eumeta japonica]|uniref:Uncharacterized protein n=1 Tax=Eumeta variegata TaxID=151549 RepID=A0A4C1XJM9_EUMVA|nr:hypothetical protein EVAR_3117_1 [Eumeta japonica]
MPLTIRSLSPVMSINHQRKKKLVESTSDHPHYRVSKPLLQRNALQTKKVQYNAQNSAAVKLVTKASQRKAGEKEEPGSIESAHHIIRRQLERQSFARGTEHCLYF